jgi:hypothetical protein
MSEIVELPVTPKFSKEQELYSRMQDLIHEYDGEVSLVAVLGVLDLAKDHVKACSV